MLDSHAPSHPDRLLRRHLTGWQALVLCAGAATFTWVVSAVFDTHVPERIVGPFHVPLAAEAIAGVVALGGSVLVLATLARDRHSTKRGVTYGTAAVVILACVLATIVWRTATAMAHGGANIGGGLFLFSAPIAVLALLIAAVPVQFVTRKRAHAPSPSRSMLVTSVVVCLSLAALAIAFL